MGVRVQDCRSSWENDSFQRFTVLPVECRRPEPTVFHGRLWGRCRSRMWVTPASQRENPKEIRPGFRHTVLQTRNPSIVSNYKNWPKIKHTSAHFSTIFNTDFIQPFQRNHAKRFFHPRTSRIALYPPSKDGPISPMTSCFKLYCDTTVHATHFRFLWYRLFCVFEVL